MRRNDRTYTVSPRRKREGKTDYRRRLDLLKSGLPRLIVRRSLKNILAQVVQYRPSGDMVVVSAHSNELKRFGWSLHKGSVTTAYLVGLLLGEKAKKAKINDAVLDIGLHPSVKGSSIYAVVKGSIDAGLRVPCNPAILPTEDRLHGKHVETYATALAADKEAYQRQFSAYLKQGINPKDVAKHVQEIKAKIVKGV